jgi:ABC-type amino acid transport substrate-binding protein
MSTKTIRCGYITWKPYNYFTDLNDPTTRTGIAFDIMNEIGRILDLKIEWAEEMGWGDIGQGFQTGRYDMACTVMWPDAPKYKNFALTRPIFYSAAYPWVRADDTRFDNQPEKSNDPAVKIGVIDGAFSYHLAREVFPQASLAALPQSAQGGEFYLSLINKKSDVINIDIDEANAYLAEHPGTMRRVKGAKPLKILPIVLAVPADSPQMKTMIDGALSHMINNGFAERIQKKYKTNYILPTKDFTVPLTD